MVHIKVIHYTEKSLVTLSLLLEPRGGTLGVITIRVKDTSGRSSSPSGSDRSREPGNNNFLGKNILSQSESISRQNNYSSRRTDSSKSKHRIQEKGNNFVGKHPVFLSGFPLSRIRWIHRTSVRSY